MKISYLCGICLLCWLVAGVDGPIREGERRSRLNERFLSPAPLTQSPSVSAAKVQVAEYIEEVEKDLIYWSDSLWRLAEPSLQEVKSSQLLITVLRQEGFKVQEGICGIPSMFIASYGTSAPTIGLFGEYDADFGATHPKVLGNEKIRTEGYGHGAGHNLLAVGSLGAALALKKSIENGHLAATVKYFGCTAEGSLGGKTYLARDGYLDDLDVSLYWHPAPVTSAPPHGWDGLIDFDMELVGKKTHAIRDTVQKPTVLDASVLLLEKLQKLRDTATADTRINYIVKRGGQDIRFVPDTVILGVRIQAARQTEVQETFETISDAMLEIEKITGVQALLHVRSAMHAFVPNEAGMRCVYENMQLLGSIRYTREEQEYAKVIQQYLKLTETGVSETLLPFRPYSQQQLNGYASDIGDVSWFAPELYFVVCALPPVPMHDWPGTAFTAHSIGHKGMLYAAKLLSWVAIDFVEDQELRRKMQREFADATAEYRYRSFLTPAPPDLRYPAKVN